MPATRYTGRFAPSPTGPLHAGSVVAALASWLDARAATGSGRWLVRIEDVDQTRCRPALAHLILQQLQALGLVADEPPEWQSRNHARYTAAMDRLRAMGATYPCACSRKDIQSALTRLAVVRARAGELVYPGTCRQGLGGKTPLATRLRISATAPAGHQGCIDWVDRRLGAQRQDVGQAVGDFVVQRADGSFLYQLAVVADDAAQGVTDVVRGADLADNTARQILLQQALGLPRPRYLHTPVVVNTHGEKLSKQTGARAVDTTRPLETLQAAAQVLGLATAEGDVAHALAAWVAQWRELYNPSP